MATLMDCNALRDTHLTFIDSKYSNTVEEHSAIAAKNADPWITPICTITAKPVVMTCVGNVL